MKRATTSLFAQLIQKLPRAAFQAIVSKYQADAHAKGITTWDLLVAMLFAQMAGASSLREIEIGLKDSIGKIFHCGARALSKSTLSYGNEHRDYRVFRDFYFEALSVFDQHIRQSKGRKLSLKFSKPVYSLDSTLITLCLSLFNWAQYRRHKGGIKVHTILNNDTLLPEVMVMTDGKVSDIALARSLQLPTNQCILIMDRGYSDYEFFAQLDDQTTTFVTRLKEGAVTTSLKKGVIKEFDGQDEKWGDYCIQFVGQLVNEKVKQKNFRLVQWYDAEAGRWFDFVTNDWEHSAKDIAWLYRDRWEIEKFFRRLKQNLKIKSFVGTSQNAVLVQIWTAAIALLLLEVLRAASSYRWGFSILAWYIRLSFLTHRELADWLNNPPTVNWIDTSPPEQLRLF